MKWDRGIDYETLYSLLLKDISRAKTVSSRCSSFILLIQLRNGLRISEAVRAFKEHLMTGKAEVEIPVSKKKKPEKRMVIIPQIQGFEPRACVELLMLKDKQIRDRVRRYLWRKHRINTHSLRYAFITHLLKRGVNPSIISKITRHSKLDFILSYTQQKAADEVLRDPSLF